MKLLGTSCGKEENYIWLLLLLSVYTCTLKNTSLTNCYTAMLAKYVSVD